MNGMLPSNWVSVELSKAVIYGKGKKPKILSEKNREGFVPYINIKAFEKGVIDEYADIGSSRLIDENDVLVVWDGARFGLTGMGITGAAGSTLMVLKPVVCNSKYLYSFINRYYSYINSKPKGTGTPHVNPDVFWKLLFPIAPINEQKRIVAKLDVVMPRIAAVKERLEKIPAILKRFRQSVLDAALSGKLTENWRGDHSEIESVENVLSVVGDKFSSDYLNVFEETQAESLPAKWIHVPLENLGKIQGGGTPSKSEPNYWAGTIPWISPKDMKVDKIYSGKDFISNAALEKTSVKLIPKGSILFVVRGMILAHTFPVALTMNEVTINQDMKGITPFDVVDSAYLFLVFKNIQSDVLSYIKEATHGTLRLEMSIIKTFAVPLPPIEEQKEIVRQVDKLFALADKVENHYQKAKDRVDKLSQSVLAKAFRGELVPQDPNDEPAEKLLERIRQEKVLMEKELKESRTRRIRKKAVKKTSRSIK